MSDFIVRRARLDDLEVLLEFEQGIIKAERPMDPTLAEDPISYYDISELIKSNDTEVIVVENSAKIIAILCLFRLYVYTSRFSW